MVSLEAYYINKSPFYLEKEVGTLLFAEYPSTVVFVDTEGRPIIREWVDSTPEGNIDRFFYFKTNRNNLNLFINGDISHKNLIEIAEGNLYYFEDINSLEEKVVTRAVLPMNKLGGYSPGETFIDAEDIPDYEEIISHFHLGEASYYLNSAVGKVAIEKDSETFDFHMEEGNGVGFGTVHTGLFVRSVGDFESLYQEAGLDALMTSSRGEIPKKSRYIIEPLISTEIFHQMAASYSVLLRPTRQLEFGVHDAKYDTKEKNQTAGQKTATTLFNIINASLNQEVLGIRYSEYSPRLVDALRKFMQGLSENRITVGLAWFSPTSSVVHNEEISYEKASLIVNNIEQLSTEDEERLSLSGKFDLVNCTTGHFGFNSNNGTFTGFFAEEIKESIRLINFVDTYTVSITRKIRRVASKKNTKIEHTITAYYKGAIS